MNILIIEDNPTALDTLEESIYSVCKTLEFPLVNITNIQYEQDAENVNPEDFDIIFVDYKLWGEKDGLYFGRHFRTKNNCAVIVMITAFLGEIKSQSNNSNIFDAYIQKPLNESEIKNCINLFIANKPKIINCGPKLGYWMPPKTNAQEKEKDVHKLFIDNYFIIRADPVRIERIKENSEKWYREIKKLINSPKYIIPKTISESWRANTLVGKDSQKNGNTTSLIENKLSWRRIILMLIRDAVKDDIYKKFKLTSTYFTVKPNRFRYKAFSELTLREDSLTETLFYKSCLINPLIITLIEKEGFLDSNTTIEKKDIDKLINTNLGFSKTMDHFNFNTSDYSGSIFEEEDEIFA